MNTVNLLLGNPLFCLFLTIGLGLLVGKISIKGINLGAAGVLFVALVMGHFGFRLPDGCGKIGLVLFIYCIGISAGGRFFSALAKEGSRAFILALVTTISGVLILWGGISALDLPSDISIGLYAGAMSSAPALAAASESLTDQSGLIVGYGIAYPMGIIGIILFVQIIPKIIYRRQIEEELNNSTSEEEVLLNVLVEVTNSALVGRRIAEFGHKHLHRCQIARRLQGERLLPLAYEDTFLENQHILMVGREEDLQLAIDLIGQRSDRDYVRDIEHERKEVQVSTQEFIGKTINEIAPLQNYGVMITRIARYGFTFVPERDTVIEGRDVIRIIGRPEGIKNFAAAIGHQSRGHENMELLSLTVGLALGVLLGMIPFSLPGSEAITLGLAGGPLIISLILGHFGHIGKLVTHIPRDTRKLLQDIGLVFFVADAGIKGGAAFVETFQLYGLPLFLLGTAITLGSTLITFLVAAYGFKLSPLATLGAICGSMTSTPALGSVTSKYQSKLPVINYATIYPVALIIITLTAKVLVGILN